VLHSLIGTEAADIAQLGAQIADIKFGKPHNDAELLEMFGKLTEEAKAAALQQKSTAQSQPAQSSVVMGEGGGGRKYWCTPERMRSMKTQVTPLGSLPFLRKR